MYIKIEDYKSQITAELLDIVTEAEASLLKQADKFATDTIDGYIGHRYDLSTEYAKTEYDRNYQVLTWAIYLSLYNLFHRVADTRVPEKVIKDYDDTIEELKQIGSGKVNVNLELKIITDNEGVDSVNNLRRIGSEPRRSHHI